MKRDSRRFLPCANASSKELETVRQKRSSSDTIAETQAWRPLNHYGVNERTGRLAEREGRGEEDIKEESNKYTKKKIRKETENPYKTQSHVIHHVLSHRSLCDVIVCHMRLSSDEWPACKFHSAIRFNRNRWHRSGQRCWIKYHQSSFTFLCCLVRTLSESIVTHYHLSGALSVLFFFSPFSLSWLFDFRSSVW